MLIKYFIERHLESRAECAKLLGVSINHLNNLIYYKRKIKRLDNGDWVLLTNQSKIIKSENVKWLN